VRDAGVKSSLADVITAPPGLNGNPATNAIRTAPVVIVALAQKGLSGFFNGQTVTDKGGSWFMFDIALAMENLVLAAVEVGLGTVHVGLFDAAKVASILGVPDEYAVVEMTPLGYPEYQPTPRPRKSLGEIVYYEKFGQGK
jgi:nitroreductase